MKLLPPLSPSAVKPHEKWLICITLPDGYHRIVESAYNEISAERGRKILQDHDDENGHPSVYWVKERDIG